MRSNATADAGVFVDGRRKIQGTLVEVRALSSLMASTGTKAFKPAAQPGARRRDRGRHDSERMVVHEGLHELGGSCAPVLIAGDGKELPGAIARQWGEGSLHFCRLGHLNRILAKKNHAHIARRNVR